MAAPVITSLMSHNSQKKRSAITLIEMMISVALTLIVVLAIVRVFDMLGGSVSDSRAIMQLSAQLRQATNQLQKDLDRLTVTTIPPADPGSAPGFFEYIEGPDRDKAPNWGTLHDTQVFGGEHLLKDASGNFVSGLYGNVFVDESGWYGDLDDVLMFTIASDGEPFRGRLFTDDGSGSAIPTIVESNYALVVWWIQRTFDVAGLPTGFQLHRRQLLVLDDPGVAATPLTRYLRTFDVSPSGNFVFEMNRFYNLNDVAVRLPTHREKNQSALTNRLMLCTLEELTERQNRYAHLPQNSNPSVTTPPNFPYPLFLPRYVEQRIFNSGRKNYLTGDAWNFISLHAKRTPPPDATYSNTVFFDFSGEDAVLSGLLAFDVKAYDPRAPLFLEPVPAPPASPVPNTIVARQPYVSTPSDAGYDIPNSGEMVGAFVDLFYLLNHPGLGAVQPGDPVLQSHFAFAPNGLSQLTAARMSGLTMPGHSQTLSELAQTAVYDTWSTTYERDDLDQNGSGMTADWGVDGIDNDGNGLVDDVLENDTLPPYPVPLRGIEVTIRALEPASEQVRQASVVANFKGH